MHSTFTVVFSKLVPQATNDYLIYRDPIHKFTGYIILIELMPSERTLCFADEEPDKLFSTSQTNPSTKKQLLVISWMQTFPKLQKFSKGRLSSCKIPGMRTKNTEINGRCVSRGEKCYK